MSESIERFRMCLRTANHLVNYISIKRDILGSAFSRAKDNRVKENLLIKIDAYDEIINCLIDLKEFDTWIQDQKEKNSLLNNKFNSEMQNEQD